MDPRASHRLSVLSGHLAAPAASPPGGEVELQPLAGRAGSGDSASTSYATATGSPSSYARVHGEVSRAPARWRRIATVAKEELREVKYEKSEGEGIARVSREKAGWRRTAGGRRQPGGSTQTPAFCVRPAEVPRSLCLTQITIDRPEKRNAFTPRTGVTGRQRSGAREQRNIERWERCSMLHCSPAGWLPGPLPRQRQ